MKKKDKISLLMFKKADNTISEKELNKLNKYLKKHSDLNEEYVLIKNIKDELKNQNNSPLPSDFKVKLREKLVDYNLNNAPLKSKKNLFKINITATAVLAVFLIAFSFGINYNPHEKMQNKEIMPSNNYKTSQSVEDKDISKSTNESSNSENSNNKERIINEDKSRTSNQPVLFNNSTTKPQEKLPENKEKEENTPAIANQEHKISETEVSSESLNDKTSDNETANAFGNENIHSGGNAGGGGGGSSFGSGGSGGSGGQGSMATSPIYDFSHSVENIVIITNCDNSLFNDIKMEEIEKNIFKIDIKEYTNVINILNDIPYEIKNFSEENTFKPYFHLVNKQ